MANQFICELNQKYQMGQLCLHEIEEFEEDIIPQPDINEIMDTFDCSIAQAHRMRNFLQEEQNGKELKQKVLILEKLGWLINKWTIIKPEPKEPDPKFIAEILTGKSISRKQPNHPPTLPSTEPELTNEHINELINHPTNHS